MPQAAIALPDSRRARVWWLEMCMREPRPAATALSADSGQQPLQQVGASCGLRVRGGVSQFVELARVVSRMIDLLDEVLFNV